jgi:hypothetical protein
MISELLNQLKSVTSAIQKNEAINVNSKNIKQGVISAATCYFKDCRDQVSRILNDDVALGKFDKDWQRLIKLAHGNNAKNSYLALLKGLLKKTTDLKIATHIAVPSTVIAKLSYSQAEGILISTLDQLLPSAAQSYRQGVKDLNSTEERFSHRGTAAELRECLRETLDLLAPDEKVKEESWFKLEPNCSGPTMKQKVRFVLSYRGKNKTQRSLAEKSVGLIESLCGEITRAIYDRASVSTHIQTTKQEVAQMKRYLDAVLFDLLEIGQPA